MRSIKILAFAAATFAAATAAQAVTFTSSAGAPDPGHGPGEVVLVDFNGPLAPGYTLTGDYQYKTGTTQGQAAAPAGDTTRYLYVSSALPTNTATLTTAFDLSRINFYWGSIDTYNTVDVLGAGGATIFTLNGSQLPQSDGNQTAANSNRRVFFTAGAGEVITGLRFTSTGVAFEFDTVAGRDASMGTGSTVPEPAVWAMLLGGFGLVGAAARRRRTTIVAA